MSGAVTRYVEAYRAFTQNGGGRAPSWLRELRENALSRFAAAGFPSTRQEEWRFTSVQPIAETGFVMPAGPAPRVERAAAHQYELCEAGRHLLVFVNGRYEPALSSVEGLPQGARVGSLAAALGEDGDLVRQYLGSAAARSGSPFGALNTAFLEDGAFVYVPAGLEIAEPIQFLYLTVPGPQPLGTSPRSLVVVDKGARASVVETYGAVGDGHYWTNSVTEILVADEGRADCYRVQRESESGFHTAVTCTLQGRRSVLHLHPVAFGAALARHDIHLVMDGEHGECILNGLYILGGRQHCDHHTTIDHAKPHNESHEYMNGVLDGEARSVFTGRIIVRPGAQRTDSKQTNNNLVLSDRARADSQPQLEIYADDVKCTHGATLGPLDEKAMFYLRSRGVDPLHARSLLTYGFGAEILSRMEIAPLQAQLDRLVRRRLLGGHVH